MGGRTGRRFEKRMAGLLKLKSGDWCVDTLASCCHDTEVQPQSAIRLSHRRGKSSWEAYADGRAFHWAREHSIEPQQGH